MKIIERIYIRLLWIGDALRPKKELCPPKCSEGHTYKWPCQARIRKPPKPPKSLYMRRLE